MSAFFGTVVWYNSIKWFGEGDDDMLWEFEVAGVRSWKRVHHQYKNGKVWVFTPDSLKEWEWRVVRHAFKGGLVQYGGIRGDIKVEIDAYVKKTWYRDVDNIAKGVLDALQGWFLEDDKYIVDLHVRKIKSEGNSEFLVVRIEGEPSVSEFVGFNKEIRDTGFADVGEKGFRAVKKFGKYVVWCNGKDMVTTLSGVRGCMDKLGIEY